MFKVSISKTLYNSDAIQNVPVSDSLPLAGELLTFSESEWISQPKILQNISSPTGTLEIPTSYYILPEESNYTLPNPTGGYTNKTLISNDSTISTQFGSLQLSPENTTANLIYNSQMWYRYNNSSYNWYAKNNSNNFLGSGATFAYVYQGFSVSMTENGDSVISGGFGDNNYVGASWIFSLKNGSWQQDGNKLVSLEYNSETPVQGYSVAISPNNAYLAVGAPYDNMGSVFIYINDNGWKLQKKVTGNPNSYAQFGRSLSFSQNGMVLAVGAPNDNEGSGLTYIFTVISGDWELQTSILGSSEYSSYQGISVSLSANGTTLIVGGYQYNGGYGAVWVFDSIDNIWSETSKLTVSDSIGASQFGISSAISGDGYTIIAGGYSDNGNIGAVWIFGIVGGSWQQQVKLVPEDYTSGGPQIGSSVAISYYGNTIVFGAPYDTNGTCWIYTRSLGIWSQIAKITNGLANSQFGISASMSYDGLTFVSGSSEYYNEVGACWIYKNVNGIWTLQSPALVGTGSYNNSVSIQGASVSLSGDGTILAEGSPTNYGEWGSVWIMQRDPGTYIWKQKQILRALDNIGTSRQGFSVYISSDGNTLAFGGPQDNGGLGAVWIFGKDSNDVWSEQAKLVGSGYVGNSSQGQSVCLSSDGNSLVFGGTADDNSVGAVWYFTKTDNEWSQVGKLVGTGSSGQSLQGASVAISADGSTIASGGYNNNEGEGAVWIFNGQVQEAILVGGGTSVSLSYDGNILATGNAYVGQGYVNIFSRNNSVWTQIVTLAGNDMVPTQSSFGISCMMTPDGSTLVIGGNQDNDYIGAVWVFTKTGNNWVQQGSKSVVPNTNRVGTSVSVSNFGNIMVSGNYNGISVFV